MNEAAKETNERPEGSNSGSGTGLEHMDGTGRGQVLLVHREQTFRPTSEDTKRIKDGKRVCVEKSPERKYTEKELREKLSIANSVESRSGYGAENLELKLIGTIETENPERFYRIYEDIKGDIWYQTMFMLDGLLVNETEYIFGRKNEKRVCG